MDKNKAIICTVLLVIVWCGVVFVTCCWRDGIIFRYISSFLSGLWYGDITRRFYHWLRKNN